MAEATVSHVLATIQRTSELAEAHDAEHRQAAIALHRDTLDGIAVRIDTRTGERIAPTPPTVPHTGRRQ